MNNSFTEKISTVLAVDFPVYNMLWVWKERNKRRYSLTILKTVKCIAQ